MPHSQGQHMQPLGWSVTYAAMTSVTAAPLNSSVNKKLISG